MRHIALFYYFIIISIYFLVTNCKPVEKIKKDYSIIIENLAYTSVAAFGVKGDGNTDDVESIQVAFNNCKNIYFPKGKYLLGHPQYHPSHNPFALYITTKSLASHIYFEEGAELFIKDYFGKPGEKYATILVYTDDKDIELVEFNGISINANKTLQHASIAGIHTLESKGNIKKFVVSNAKIKNLPGGGINTFALHNDFKNIYTENLGGHGIGAANPYNLYQEHYLNIDGYTSINDQAYSIDFAGASIGEGGKLVQPGDFWTGNVKNVVSKGSKNGIKTAGLWNLTIDSILIEGSKYNGFFLSKDAIGRTVTINHMIVRDCLFSGVYLNGVSNFVGNDILIENCNSGFYVNYTKVKVNGLKVDGKNKNSVGIRVEGDVEINNFSVTGLGPDYPVWITGKNVKFSNGTIYNNEGPWSFLVHEGADNVILDNIQFYDDRAVPKQIYGYMILQKQGSLTIKNASRSGKAPMIENRTGIAIRTN
jgi:hypothetical protein